MKYPRCKKYVYMYTHIVVTVFLEIPGFMSRDLFGPLKLGTFLDTEVTSIKLVTSCIIVELL